jgi:hypothetical protein
MMALMSAVSGLIGSQTGSKGEHGSTYGKGALSLLDQVQQQVSGMRNQGDVTQNQNYQTGQDWLQSMFSDPQFFNQFEAPIRRDYEENVIPGLANRFAGMGSGGSLGSTAFRNALGREGTNLSTNLAALRGGMQQNAVPQLQSYSQQPFQNYMQMLGLGTTPTQNTYQGPTQGFMGSLAAPFAQGAATMWGQQAGQQAGNPNVNTNSAGAGSAAGWDNQFRQMGLPSY